MCPPEGGAQLRLRGNEPVYKYLLIKTSASADAAASRCHLTNNQLRLMLQPRAATFFRYHFPCGCCCSGGTLAAAPCTLCMWSTSTCMVRRSIPVRPAWSFNHQGGTPGLARCKRPRTRCCCLGAHGACSRCCAGKSLPLSAAAAGGCPHRAGVVIVYTSSPASP